MRPLRLVWLLLFPLILSTPVLAAPTTQFEPFSEDKTSTRVLPPKDQQLFEQLIIEAEQKQIKTQPFGQIMEFFSLRLLDQPYVAGLLDKSANEDLFLSLTQFDCVLFVESVIAIAHSLQTQVPSPEIFAQKVETLRYRNGQRADYCSRLHYFSEWLEDNQARGNVLNLTRSLGGIPLPKQLQFMSRNRDSYRQLTGNESYQCIIRMEDRLASLPLFYIPTGQINQIESQLEAGDIIAVATQIPYLDVTHTGLIYQNNGRASLIHASPRGAVEQSNNLTRYVTNVESAIGIMVARPIANLQHTHTAPHHPENRSLKTP